MSGRITVVAAAMAGGGREAGLAGPGGTADFGEWSSGWRERCACHRGGPPYPRS